MNILPVSYSNFYNASAVLNRKKQNNINFGININTRELIRTNTIQSNNGTFMYDFVERSAKQYSKTLKIPAEHFLNDVEKITDILNPYEVSFDREYCEPNVIKSGGTAAKKVLRSKTFRIPDWLRATQYSKNIYDMDILFNHILPAYKNLGYTVAEVEMPLEDAMKRGYTPSKEDIENGYVKLPDIDIRLDEEEIENIQAIPKRYKYSLGKPQESGYEDIQIRFVKKKGGHSKQSLLHELIILTGPEYARVKHEESEKIYSYIRQFKELNILNSEDKNTVKLIRDRIKVVKETFSDEITKKLYGNAMSLDMTGEKSGRSISINKKDEKDLTANYNIIDKITIKYYKDLLNNTQNPQEKACIETQKNADMQKLGEIRRGLTKSLEFYKKQYSQTE